MEEIKSKKKGTRTRRKAKNRNNDKEMKATEDWEASGTKPKIERVCAPADYKVMEELIEDPMNEERERRRKAIEKWTEESHEEFANGLARHGKRFRKLAEPLPDITVADCVEHYYMTKPFYFDFHEWKAHEKAKDDGLEPSSKEHEGTQSSILSEPKASSAARAQSEGTKNEEQAELAQPDIIMID